MVRRLQYLLNIRTDDVWVDVGFPLIALETLSVVLASGGILDVGLGGTRLLCLARPLEGAIPCCHVRVKRL